MEAERISGVGRRGELAKPGLGRHSLAAAALLVCISLGGASAALFWLGKPPARQRPQPVPSSEPTSTPERGAALPDEGETPTVALPQPAREPALAPVVAHTPEDLLADGDRLRAGRHWVEADEAYTRAAQRSPQSQTAYRAHVAAAALRLEHLHDARGALAHYRAALRHSPTGPLRADIQWGIAASYRALGDRASERAALRMFMREHPSSSRLPEARARLH